MPARHSTYACRNPNCRPYNGQCYDMKGDGPLCPTCKKHMTYGWFGTSYMNIASQGTWLCDDCRFAHETTSRTYLIPHTSPQEVLDHVTEHLLTQLRRATTFGANYTEQCVYRSHEGLKCAVGCLIPDNDYNSCLEQQSINDLISDWAEHKRKVKYQAFCHPDLVELLHDLQIVHDQSDVPVWHAQLDKLYFEYKLDPRPVLWPYLDSDYPLYTRHHYDSKKGVQ